MEAGLLQQEGGGGGGGGRVVLKKGPWTATEDAILVAYVQKHGEGNWNSLQKHSGLSRCGKSCRLRWANHLRPNLKKGAFTMEEERHIIELHSKLGNKWARMAAQLPGRTDNEIKNYWNTRIKRRQRAGLPVYPPEVQSMRLPLPCDQAQGNGLSTSTSADSDSDTLSSPKTEMPRLNLAPIEGFSVPVVLCDIPMNLVPSHTFTMPIEPIKGFNSPSNNHCYPAYSQPTDTMTKCFESSRREPRCGRPRDSMLARGLPLEPDPGIGGQFPGVQPNYHGFASGHYSFFGLDSSLKMELPSGQYVDAARSADDNSSALISPFTPLSSSKSMPSEVDAFEHVSNSGLLECLLQEAETKQRASHFSSGKDVSSVLTRDDYTFASKAFWTEDSNASAPPENYTVTSAMEPIQSTQVGTWKNTSSSEPTLKPVIKLEEGCGALSWVYTDHLPSTLRDVVRPYEMGLSEWYNTQASNSVGTITYPVAADAESGVINSGSGLKLGYSGPGPPIAGHVWELGSCQWNNMPGACLIGDYAADCRPFNTVAEHSLDPCAIF